ncbi:SS1 [Symbiodinium natans]|uniref:SS1 protein n=1 Tax=Symbiodinium natans TaxID=878477 RepID=A0A812PRB1_9DINO|nr:SS1 [Symbiodinium natans]
MLVERPKRRPKKAEEETAKDAEGKRATSRRHWRKVSEVAASNGEAPLAEAKEVKRSSSRRTPKKVSEVEAANGEAPLAEAKEVKRSRSRRTPRKVSEVEASNGEAPLAEAKEVKRSTSRRTPKKVTEGDASNEAPSAEAKEAKRATSKRRPKKATEVQEAQFDREASRTSMASMVSSVSKASSRTSRASQSSGGSASTEVKARSREAGETRKARQEQFSREASMASVASAASAASVTSGVSKASGASHSSEALAAPPEESPATEALTSTAEVLPSARREPPQIEESPATEALTSTAEVPPCAPSEPPQSEESPATEAPAASEMQQEAPAAVEAQKVPQESPAKEVSFASVASVPSERQGNPKTRTVRVSKFQQAQQARLFGTKQPEKANVSPAPAAPLLEKGARKGSFSLLPDPEESVTKPELAQGEPLMLKKGSLSLLPEPESEDCCERKAAASRDEERPTTLRIEEEQPGRAEPEEKCEALTEASKANEPNEANAIKAPEAEPATSLGAQPDDGEGYESSGTQTPKTKALSEISPSESGDGGMERVFSLSALDALLQDPEEKADLRSHLETELQDQRPKYQAAHLSTPVVVVSSEVNPWSKTGGLAMVAGSYGYEFAMRGHRTMVVAPRYGDYKDAEYVGYCKVWMDGREHELRYFHLYQDLGGGKGTDYIFVDHPSYHRDGLYVDREGKEYVDNLQRYALLSVAALEAPLVLKLRGSTYGQDCLFIANDWQTGLLPVYHLYKYRRNRTYLNSRTLFVIHNIGYQGKYRLTKFPLDSYLGLPPEAICLLQGEDLNLGDDCMNLMSAAILSSDRVLTVSPNYAKEVQSPEGGQGLHDILTEKGRQLRMAGILNGIADEWDPRTDPHIPRNYGLSDVLEGKAHCKRELQKSLGLHEDPGVALMGFCGRLCYQKGVQLITEAIPWLLERENTGVLGRVQLILMGKGDDLYANQLSQAENSNRGRVCGYVGFDPKVEHRMMAGCDFLLMPSQYEPCGLPQMYAQAYGTVPVVHETGGLKDSVMGLWEEERDRTTATGFLFCGFDDNHFKERLYQALEVYHKKPDLFRQIQRNGLEKNYYWPQAIDEYEKHLDWTLDGPAALA